MQSLKILLRREINKPHLFWKAGRGLTGELQTRALQTCACAKPLPRAARAREPSVVGSLLLSGRFPPVGFPQRAREAGPAGRDGVAAGPEARAGAGQRTRRPPRLSTGFLQVSGQSHAHGLWGWTCAGWFLGKWPGLGSPWRIRSFSQGQPLPASPGPKSLSRRLPETGPKPALETEPWRGGESIWAAPQLCFLESSEHCQTLTAWPWESFFFPPSLAFTCLPCTVRSWARWAQWNTWTSRFPEVFC